MAANKTISEKSKDFFYLRFYSGHSGRFGHEFVEFDFMLLDEGTAAVRYVNNTQYRNDGIIRKKLYVSRLVVEELKRIVKDADIMREDDTKWPAKNKDGKQELEIHLNGEKISLQTAKIGSLGDVTDSDDPEGLRVFYYLVQDLRAFVFSLISFHYKIKPVART